MENLWKVNDVAAAVNVSVQTVYRYVAGGDIPFHKFRRAVRFSPPEIEKWLEGRKKGLRQDPGGNAAGVTDGETVTPETGGGV